jgi:hypothetical protein
MRPESGGRGARLRNGSELAVRDCRPRPPPPPPPPPPPKSFVVVRHAVSQRRRRGEKDWDLFPVRAVAAALHAAAVSARCSLLHRLRRLNPAARVACEGANLHLVVVTVEEQRGGESGNKLLSLLPFPLDLTGGGKPRSRGSRQSVSAPPANDRSRCGGGGGHTDEKPAFSALLSKKPKPGSSSSSSW